MNNSVFINKIIVCLVCSVCFVFKGVSQEVISVEEHIQAGDTVHVEVRDTLVAVSETVDSLTQAVLRSADSIALPAPEEVIVIEPFKPNPNKALLLSALVPGLGQIYNRKYWKLPILYGGLMGCLYAVTWNNKNYSDYSNAYWATVQQDPLEYKDLWKHFVQGTIDWDDDDAMLEKAQDATFQSQLKRKKDYFRRYRDMSIFIGVGVYVLGILDAYVDAHLFDFDISPDLSMRVEPVVSPGNSQTPHVYGINCSIKF
ncbi:DUF5683 domain-containing protein [Massilibacteroides sp.]|uniref:DUF5683 domain-containing protein n=1 Tax=Massilibacteroides sp. TaxID=2034766 RepID=UPI00262E61CE|nr:DUF5683 domain-containing protein [Massilibacteroides sp.]MDD4514814.1 DUF5683 domain-containing protein [Massilibacteroides sp.]